MWTCLVWLSIRTKGATLSFHLISYITASFHRKAPAMVTLHPDREIVLFQKLETPCSLSPCCLPMTFDLWIGFLWMTFDFWIGGIQGPIVTKSDQSDSNQTVLEPLSHLSFHTMAGCSRQCPDADSSKILGEVISWSWLTWSFDTLIISRSGLHKPFEESGSLPWTNKGFLLEIWDYYTKGFLYKYSNNIAWHTCWRFDGAKDFVQAGFEQLWRISRIWCFFNLTQRSRQ